MRFSSFSTTPTFTSSLFLKNDVSSFKVLYLTSEIKILYISPQSSSQSCCEENNWEGRKDHELLQRTVLLLGSKAITLGSRCWEGATRCWKKPAVSIQSTLHPSTVLRKGSIANPASFLHTVVGWFQECRETSAVIAVEQDAWILGFEMINKICIKQNSEFVYHRITNILT